MHRQREDSVAPPETSVQVPPGHPRRLKGSGLPLRNSGWFFLGCLALTLAAFWPGFVQRLQDGGVSRYVHVHSALMLSWFGMLIAQPFLIRAGKRDIHRWLGRASLMLAPATILAAMLMIHSRMRAVDAPGFVEDAEFLFLVLGQLAIFAIAYGLALVWRRRPALHARYMACTLLGLVDPVVARLAFHHFPRLPTDQMYQGISLALICLVTGALIVRERNATQGRAAFPLMLALTVAFYGLFFTIARSESWTIFAAWYRGLPLT